MSKDANAIDEIDLLKWPDPLSAEWQTIALDVVSGVQRFRITQNGEDRGTVSVRFVTDTRIRETYPVSARDRLVEPPEGAPSEVIQLVSEEVMGQDPKCRRLVIAVDEEDVQAVDRAERGGYRYVLDVDLPGRAVALLAAEPDWVLEESRNINDVPLKSGAEA